MRGLFSALLTVMLLLGSIGVPSSLPAASASPISEPVATQVGWTSPAGAIQVRESAQPPALTAAQLAPQPLRDDRPPVPPPPDDPTAPRRPGPPLQPATEARPELPGPLAPNDFTLFRQTGLTSSSLSDLTSTTNEPSVAQKGNTVVMTGNWYAARSANGGTSFTFINPFSFFPSAAGGFCCDQVVIYDPSQDLFIWVLQYINNSAGNVDRIAVARGEAAVASGSWNYVDITAQTFGRASGVWLDFPHIALSSGYLHLTTNAFTNAGSYDSSIAARFSLTDLANLTTGNPITNTFFSSANGTLTPTANAGSTMYIVRHNTTAQLVLYSWPDANPSPTNTTVGHASYLTSYSCTTPDSFNPCGRVDSRILAAWVTGSEIGALWMAGAGTSGLGTFANVYLQGARISTSTLTLLADTSLWNASYAIIYPSVNVNSSGHLGLTASITSSSIAPSTILGLQDDVSPSSWETITARTGTHGPARNRWGDYSTVRPAQGGSTTWVAVNFTQQGPCTSTSTSQCTNVEPRFYWFGRERDNPINVTPTVTPTPTVTATATATATPTSTLVATATPTATATSTATPTATATNTATPTATPTSTATSTATSSPTLTPTSTPTSTPTATLAATVTATPTATSIPPVTTGALTWYFAEGYTGFGFDEYLTIQNPNSTAASVRITYYLAGSTPVVKLLTVAPTSRRTVNVHETAEGVGRGREVSAKVESLNEVGLIVERPMYFTYVGRGGAIPGGHNALGATAPRATWYFAEGYTGGAFDEYLTIMNPNLVPANVTITYYLASGAPVVKTISVGAERRYSVRVHELAEGVGPGQEVSAIVSVNPATPIVVERPMYFRYGARFGPVVEGHVVMGVPAPATSWYFADGDTSATTDEYLTILNPNVTPATVTLTYWVGGAVAATKTVTVTGQRRHTVLVWSPLEGVGPNQSVSVRLTTSNTGGIVVERPQYARLNGVNTATTIPGATQPTLAWQFAEGYTGAGFTEHLTVLNPGSVTATVQVTYYLPSAPPRTVAVTVLPQQRVSLLVNSPVEGVGPNQAVSATVASTNGVPIVAERTMTFGYGGAINGGHAGLGYAP